MAASLSPPTHQPALRRCLSPSPKLSPSRPTSVSCWGRVSSGGFDSFTGRRKGVSGGQRGMVKVAAFGGSDGGGVSDGAGGGKGVRAFEQEAFIGSGSNSSEPMADGLESTINRMSKWIVFALFSAFILWRHNAESLWAAMGSVINAMLSVVLKRILNQERPLATLRSDPGMPSSHAQSIFFMVVFVILSIVDWLGFTGLSLTLGPLVLAMGAYFSWLRVSQQLHTMSQVVVGAVLGSAFSGLWYWSWNAFVLEAFNSLLWVRVVIILGAVGFSLGFVLHVIRHWFRDDR